MSSFRKIIPLLDRVLVEKAVMQKTSKGGVLLPGSMSDSVNHGVVVSVGPGARNDSGQVVPVDLKEGDNVLLPEYGGTKVEIDKKEFVIFNASDVLAKLE